MDGCAWYAVGPGPAEGLFEQWSCGLMMLTALMRNKEKVVLSQITKKAIVMNNAALLK